MSDQSNQDQAPALALLLGLFAAVPVTLLGLFAPIISRLGAVPGLLPQLRAVTVPVVRELLSETAPLVEKVVSEAASAGVVDGGGTGTTGATDGFGAESHAERSARMIREDLQGKLNGLTYRITRFPDDVYQAVITDAALDQVLGLTPAEAQHSAYEKLVRQGITGFTDSRGRNWELSAYVDMAVRTAAQRAYNAARLQELGDAGFNYFIVSDDGHPCPLCQPWQGVILTSGTPDNVAHNTVADATAAGLFHPRCRHVLSGYRPGMPVPPVHEWGPEDQRRYDESQQQRALERAIRAAKREQAAAYTQAMKAAANRAVRQAQANMRNFIDQTGRVRVSRREQLHL